MDRYNKKDKQLLKNRDYNLAGEKYAQSLECQNQSPNISTNKAYDVSNELLELYMKYLATNRNRIVTTSSSGDPVFNALLLGCRDITVIDANLYTEPFIEYKKALIRTLRFYEFVMIIESNLIFHHSIYKKISHFLSPNARQFWDEIMLMPNDFNDIENAEFIRNQILHTARCMRSFSSPFYKDINEYNKLKDILNNEDYNITYINAEFSDFSKALGGNYESVYLSNIRDYVSNQAYINTVEEIYNNNLKPGGRILLHYDFGAEEYDDDSFPRQMCGQPVLCELLWIDKSQHKRDAIFVIDKPKTLQKNNSLDLDNIM